MVYSILAVVRLWSGTVNTSGGFTYSTCMKETLRTQLWVSLFALLVFLIGLGAGIVLDTRLSGPGRPPLRGLDSPRGRPFGRPPLRVLDSSRGRLFGRPRIGYERRSPVRVLRRLETVLDLNAEQSESLRALFRTRREQFGEIARGMHQQLDTRRDEFRASVAEILTPTQMELFEENVRGRRGRTRASGQPRSR